MNEKFYIEYLDQLFKNKVKSNKRYSLRAFAKQLGLNVATMSMVLSKKKPLSILNAIKISSRIKLNQDERLKFFESVIQEEFEEFKFFDTNNNFPSNLKDSVGE